MARTLFIYGIPLAILTALLFLWRADPAQLKQALVSVDFIGLSQDAKLEQDRLYNIKMLMDPDNPSYYLPDEKKEALVNHTVFMGATPDMVELALGKPWYETPRDQPTPINVTEKDGTTKTGVRSLQYVYFLAGDKRPTILVFIKDNTADYELYNAYKGSAADYQQTRQGAY